MPSSKRPDPGDKDRTFELAAVAGEVSAQRVVCVVWEGGTSTVPLPDAEPCAIGRSPDVELVIDSRSVSRRHALLHHAGGLSIEDLGSANGTRVRGKTLAQGERAAIDLNEPVMIGSAILIVRPSGASGAVDAVFTAEPAAPSSAPPSKPSRGKGNEGPMADVEQLIALVAPTEMSVLLLGETGAGKGHFARAIHDRSRRARGSFLHLNCAALPENLLESELFGYERGAFSGATQAKPGLLESAERGTVFLDEVGEIPLAIQAKLLVAIERREVLRIGALKPRPLDVRFVSATNRPSGAQEIVGLRPDLYFRLAGMPIQIPPLRERTGEIPALAAAFVRDAAARLGRSAPTIAPEALRALVAYPWPGNVRELATVIDRALLFCGEALRDSDLHLAPPPPPARREAAAGSAAAVFTPLPQEYEAIERRRISEALDACGGNQSRAAAMLGISRRTLVTRIEEFGLPRPRKR